MTGGKCIRQWAVSDRRRSALVRALREYFGLERTTVTYDHEITRVGGEADEFLFCAKPEGRTGGNPGVRTTVHFMHEEMAHLLV